MKTKKFPAVEQSTLDRIISLGEEREKAEDGRYPNGFMVGQTQPLPPSSADQALRNAIDALPMADAQELHALMYLGRDGLEDQTADEAIAWLRDAATSRPDEDVKRSLYEKVPLASYLRDGLLLVQTTA